MGSLAGPLITGGASILGGLFGRPSMSDAQKNQLNATTSLANQQSDLGKLLSGYMQNQYTLGSPALNQALNYYKTLAGGSTSAIQGVLAPQINQLAQTYKGASSQIANSPLITGGVRQQQLAELARQEAGQLGIMPFQARQQANASLADLGNQILSRAAGFGSAAAGAGSSAGSILGQQGNLLEQQNQFQTGQQNAFGKALSNIFLPYLLQRYGIKSPTTATATTDAATPPTISSLAGPLASGDVYQQLLNSGYGTPATLAMLRGTGSMGDIVPFLPGYTGGVNG